MRAAAWIATAIGLATAPAARAAVKAYDSSKKPGDLFVFSAQLSPTIDTRAGTRFGHAILSDDGSGTVTLDELVEMGSPAPTDVDLSLALGPGAFIFIVGTTQNSPAPGQTGIGSTAPGGSVAWGILSGWKATGSNFCISSPTTVCDFNNTPHGVTVPGIVNSTTYDLGTWNFDPVTGDYEAAAPYINSINNGGTTNSQFLLRGAFTGASLPALPLVGSAALAMGLLVVGARAVRDRRR